MGNPLNQHLIESMEAQGVANSKVLDDLNIKLGLDSKDRPYIQK
jgi:hypothetical protein